MSEENTATPAETPPSNTQERDIECQAEKVGRMECPCKTCANGRSGVP